MRNIKCNIKYIILTFLVGIFIFGTLCGCRTFQRGFVYKDWSRTMSELGIFPIFPPREDVQIGDVYLLPMHPLDAGSVEAIGGLGLTGILCDNILVTEDGKNISSSISDYYKVRPSFPSSMTVLSGALESVLDEKKDVADFNLMPVPSSTDNKSIFGDGDNTRLRQVGFPEFAVTKISQVGLNAIVPVEALSVAGGFSFNSVDQISLKIPSAESYGLPSHFLLDGFFKGKPFVYDSEGALRFKAWDPTNKVGIRSLNKISANLVKSQFNDAFQKLADNLPRKYRNIIKKQLKENKDRIWIAVVEEVYYARAIDISITKQRAKGGAAGVQPITNQMLQELDRLNNLGNRETETRKVTTDTEGREIVENIKIEDSDTAFTLATKMNDYNRELGKQSVPGGSVSVISVSGTSIGLRRSFDRPIAVGVRGVLVCINVNDVKNGGFLVELCSGD